MELPRQRMFTDRGLLYIIVPLVIEQTLNNLVGLCDGIMVSAAGEAAISGVSLVNQISGIILVLFAALATGGAVVASQYLGAKQPQTANQSAGQLMLVSGGFGLLLMTVCLLFAPWILRLFFGETEADVMDAALIYFRYSAVSYPFIALYSGGAAIFRSMGNSKISMKISLLKNVINIGGNAVCIYGLKMGVVGVAIPTLLSRAVGAVIVMILLFNPKQTLSLSLKNIFCIRGELLKKIMQIGIPTGFENCLFQLGRVLVLGMVAAWGTSQITANATANNISAMGIIISQAIGLGSVTVVGQCLGAHDIEQARFYVKKLLKWCYISQGILQLLLLVFQNQVIGLYSNLSEETVAMIKQMVTLYFSCGILIYPLAFMMPNPLRAANDGKMTMTVSVASMALCRITMAYVLCTLLGWGAFGTWVAMVMDWVVRATCFTLRWFRGKWEKKCFLT